MSLVANGTETLMVSASGVLIQSSRSERTARNGEPTYFAIDGVVQVSMALPLSDSGWTSHYAALTADGGVWTWGEEDRSFNVRLGRGLHRTDGDFLKAVQIPVERFDGLKVTSVSCGDSFTVVATETGRVFSFGLCTHGQLGIDVDDLNEWREFPVEVQGMPGEHVTMVAAAKSHTIAVCKSGRVFAWGDNSVGQLGLGECDAIVLVPTLVAGIETADTEHCWHGRFEPACTPYSKARFAPLVRPHTHVAYAHTQAHIFTHKPAYAHSQAHMFTHKPAYAHSQAHMFTHKPAYAHSQAHMFTHKPAYAHSQAHMFTHKPAYAHSQAYMFTHIHTGLETATHDRLHLDGSFTHGRSVQRRTSVDVGE